MTCRTVSGCVQTSVQSWFVPPFPNRNKIICSALLATRFSLPSIKSLPLIEAQTPGARSLFCLEVNSGILADWELIFPSVKGWTFLPRHMPSTGVWAVQRGACHSEFFHPDKNRWGPPAARYTWSRQNRTGASTLRGPPARRTRQSRLRWSSTRTENRKNDPSGMTGFSASPLATKSQICQESFLFFSPPMSD